MDGTTSDFKNGKRGELERAESKATRQVYVAGEGLIGANSPFVHGMTPI